MTQQKTILFTHSQLTRIIHVRDFYKQFIQQGDLCFDIGACWGNMLYPMALLGTKVIAVEPHEKGCNRINSTFSTLQGINYVVENVAVSDQEGKAEFLINPYAEISSLNTEWIRKVTQSKRFGENNEGWTEKKIVQTTTLSSLIKKHGKPHFVKIDVEGHESRVLKGLDVPVNAISFEYQIENIDGAMECMDILDKLGSYVYRVTVGANMEFSHKEYLDRNEVFTKILENPGRQLHPWGDIYAFDHRIPLKGMI